MQLKRRDRTAKAVAAFFWLIYLTDWGFELQLVPPNLTEALKRRPSWLLNTPHTYPWFLRLGLALGFTQMVLRKLSAFYDRPAARAAAILAANKHD